MSLLIKTNIAAENLVKAAWARAIANRERQRREQELQAAREEADRQRRRQTRSKDPLTNRRITNYRPDEPIGISLQSASPSPPLPIGNGTMGRFFRISYESGGSTITRYYSGNGLEFLNTPGFPSGSEFIVFPAGSGKAIILFSFNDGSANVYRSYYVDFTSIREVVTPSLLQTPAFPALGNQYIGSHFDLAYSNTVPFVVWYGPGIYLSPLIFPGIDPDLGSYAQVRSFTSSYADGFKIFNIEDINDPAPVVGVTLADISPTGYRWTGPDPDIYGGSEIFPLTDERWTILPITKPSSVLWPGREDVPAIAEHFYDWGAPDGCREQLLALGYSSADLSPP